LRIDTLKESAIVADDLVGTVPCQVFERSVNQDKRAIVENRR
jgi:hypothetical protein